MDCSAYVGDTAESFTRQIANSGLKGYEAIYSFEPDEKNYRMLKEKNLERLHCYCVATLNKIADLCVVSKGKGSSSYVTDIGHAEPGKKLRTDRLDNVLKGYPVTFIKMDVEGYELDSLKGAENIIKTYRPKLAVCIYHKNKDLWEIQQYIKELVPEYRLYIRAYDYTATELVLYAVIGLHKWFMHR